MKLYILFIALTFAGLFINLPLFEFVLGAMLVAPVLWLLLTVGLSSLSPGLVYPSLTYSSISYILVFAAIVALSLVVAGRRQRKLADMIADGELATIAVLFALYAVTLSYAHRWPEFIRMGERLRDYALLGSTIRSPIIPEEPWMSGYTLNYYVYWYRFGHMLSAVLGEPVWNVYHTLVSFSLAAYVAVLFRGLTRFIRFRPSTALFLSVAIGFGSNVAGIIAAKAHDDNWWGPSRVVKGAINEFPAWSFLLGDLHPHYVNLALMPFLLLILGALSSAALRTFDKTLAVIGVLIVGHFWLFSSNAWEVPMWWLVVFMTGFIFVTQDLWGVRTRLAATFKTSLSGLSGYEITQVVVGAIMWLVAAGAIVLRRGQLGLLPSIGIIAVVCIFTFLFTPLGKIFKDGVSKAQRTYDRKTLSILTLSLVLALGLWLSAKHIVPEGGDLRFVREPIALTTMKELFLHFGIPILIGALGTVLMMPTLLSAIFAAFILAVSALNADAIVLVMSLGIVSIFRVVYFALKSDKLADIIPDAIFLSGLALVALPEYVFLDDPYGGEIERMNTIFKIYTTSWFLLHIGAFSLFAQGWGKYSHVRNEILPGGFWKVTGTVTSAALAVAMVWFFIRTSRIRPVNVPIVEPRLQGLSDIEAQFPGSSSAVKFLEQQPSGIVLEAQGKPYDYTSFVSVLSNKPAFLGWANHVGLLTKKYDEVKRREDFTAEFYKQSDCQKRWSMAKAENLNYVVLGSLEKSQYGNDLASDWGCFNTAFSEKEYKILRP